MDSETHSDVTVVGAGAAGVGVGAALSHLDLDVQILERDGVGASFRSWPAEMRFLTPSFPSNAFGIPDLNAIVPNTSPGFALDCQQPSGEQYAEYLESVADHYELPIETGVEVTAVDTAPDQVTSAAVAVDGGTTVDTAGFEIETTEGTRTSDFLIWAGGQFGAPRTDLFPGSEFGVHNGTVDSWETHAADNGEEFLIVGGFESGIDAAVNLVEAGCSVTVLDRGYPWATRHPDPSETLSPYTFQRLDSVIDSGRLRLVGGANVDRIEETAEGYELFASPAKDDPLPDEIEKKYESYAEGTFTVPTRPILATGFESNLGPVSALFEWSEDGIELTDEDESTETPGLFLSGPDVQHDGQLFCFIYKFRARFPVIASTIGERLDLDTDALEPYEDANMFLEDLSCCEPVDCDC